jgi:endonuclease YncB( thermonuclease family)
MFDSIRKFYQCFSKKQSSVVDIVCESNEDAQSHLAKVMNREAMPCFSFNGKILYGIPANIYDGDTFSLIFVYNNETIKYRCRSLGYDSPEMKPPLKNKDRDKEKEVAKLAKMRFQELLFKNPNGMVSVHCHNFDKYGRILVEIWNGVDEQSINHTMIEEGHGKIYHGGKKVSWDL